MSSTPFMLEETHMSENVLDVSNLEEIVITSEQEELIVNNVDTKQENTRKCSEINIKKEVKRNVVGDNRQNLKNIAKYIHDKTGERPFISVEGGINKADGTITLKIFGNKDETLQFTTEYIKNLENHYLSQPKPQPHHQHERNHYNREYGQRGFSSPFSPSEQRHFRNQHPPHPSPRNNFQEGKSVQFVSRYDTNDNYTDYKRSYPNNTHYQHPHPHARQQQPHHHVNEQHTLDGRFASNNSRHHNHHPPQEDFRQPFKTFEHREEPHFEQKGRIPRYKGDKLVIATSHSQPYFQRPPTPREPRLYKPVYSFGKKNDD